MTFLSLDVYHRSDSTVIVFKIAAVKRLILSYHRSYSFFILVKIGAGKQHRFGLLLDAFVVISYLLLYSIAAAIRPLNIGWALSGLDLNSGCAWVATKYG